MQFLFEILIQLVAEIFGEILLELGMAAFKDAFGRENRSPVLAAFGYLVLGAVAGGVSLWLYPERFLRPAIVPGLSVLVAPLAGGAVMHAWGEFRGARGHATTNLATFWGGAALLFSYSLARVLWAR